MEPNKKKLRDDYKSRASVGGVYRITCSEMALNEAWKTYGSKAFRLEILEEIEKGETQSHKEFSEDVEALLAMVIERQGS